MVSPKKPIPVAANKAVGVSTPSTHPGSRKLASTFNVSGTDTGRVPSRSLIPETNQSPEMGLPQPYSNNVFNHLDQLSEMLTTLDTLIVTLGTRLLPVLAYPAPDALTTEEERTGPSIYCPISDRLLQIETSVQVLIDEVKRLAVNVAI